jgi:hypothetical protein
MAPSIMARNGGPDKWRRPTTNITEKKASRAGAGVKPAQLERLSRRLQPLAVSEMPLEVPSPRTTRFGSPLVLSRVHWVRPELVAEMKYLTWTGDNLLRQVVYEGLREHKPAAGVRRPVPHAKPGTQSRTLTAKKPAARSRGIPSKPQPTRCPRCREARAAPGRHRSSPSRKHAQ